MDARAFNKSKLPRHHVTKGGARALRPSEAMGLRREHAHPLFVTGVSSRTAAVPCHVQPMLNAEGLPVIAKTVQQHLQNVKSNRDQKVVCRIVHPISARGEGLGLQGSGAPDGAVVKVIDMTRLQFRDSVRDGAEGSSREGSEGSAGGLCTRDLPATLVRGDVIACDGASLDPEEDEARRAVQRDAWTVAWVAAAANPYQTNSYQTNPYQTNPYQTGTLRTYADQVGLVRTGALAHAGSRAEVACYADI